MFLTLVCLMAHINCLFIHRCSAFEVFLAYEMRRLTSDNLVNGKIAQHLYCSWFLLLTEE